MKKLYTTLVLIVSVALYSNAQTPYLLKDIISGPAGGFALSSQYAYYSHPLSVVWEKNGIIYFTAVGFNTVPNGGAYTNDMELWKSDGTASGTELLKDIYPGNEGSFPADFAVVNGTLYFTAYNSTSGRELWKTDGTTAGTEMVKEIIAGGVGGFQTSAQFGYDTHPFNVVWQSGNTFYFTASNFASAPNGVVNNIELWKSDGTDAGTVMVKDIYPGNYGSYPLDFVEINGILYFTAYNVTSGRELWKSDGTNGGTGMVKEIVSGGSGGFQTSAQFGAYTHNFRVVWENGGNFFFTANSYLSTSGGSIIDMELWKSDGTSSGTVMVKDIYAGNEASYPQDFFDINGTLYFTAYNAVSGRELWKSDGSTGGTVLVKEIISGNVGGFQISEQFGYSTHNFSVVWQSGGSFYFTANNYASAPGGYVNDIELWKSDGTSSGTLMVKDIYPGYDASNPRDFYDINGTLYFTAHNAASGRELWKTDGSNGGTVLVKEIIPAGVGFETTGQWGYYSYPFSVVWQTGNTFYFTANNFASAPGGSVNDIELWKSDGTSGGTVLVKDIYPGNEGSYPLDFKDMNGTLYFTAGNDVTGRELWKSDGTTGGTVLIKDIMAGNVGGFNMASQYIYENIPFNVAFNIGSYFYFVANDYATVPNGLGYENNPELWRSDGTDIGTTKVMEIFPGTTNGSYPSDFINKLGKIFFTAIDPANGRELWVIDLPVSDGPELISSMDWKAYPVPASNMLHITVSGSANNNAVEKLSISDINGREIYFSDSNDNATFINKNIDISTWAPGLYFVKLITAQKTEVKKIVKE